MSLDDFEVEDIGRIWQGMDLDTMGRVLRAHLVVEHFMNELLAVEGINLGALKEANLRPTFQQKLDLLYPAKGPLYAGMYQLNRIRNNFAHRPDHRLTLQEAKALNNAGKTFKQYLSLYQKARKIRPASAIDIIEAFAEWASLWMRISAKALPRLKAEMESAKLERVRLKAQAELLRELRAEETEP
jgi:hypothetical protein